MNDPEYGARIATLADVPRLAETIAKALDVDPTWSHVLPDAAQRQANFPTFWQFFITSALRYPWVHTTANCEAAAVWIPPGGADLTNEEEMQVDPLIDELFPDRAAAISVLLDQFENCRPDAGNNDSEPYYYLSLLGTHPAHAGRGLGLGLLAQNLETIDSEHTAAFLESSNPANNHRYQRHGFEAIGEFWPAGQATPVTTMWRTAR